MKKFLVIQLSRMGDIIFTLPLLSSLKKEHPGCEISVLSYKIYNRIILPSQMVDRHIQVTYGEIDKVATSVSDGNAAENGFPELAEKYDEVINLAYGNAPAKICSSVDAPVKHGRIASQKNEVRLQGTWMKYLFAAIQHRRHNLMGMADIFTRVGNAKNRRISHFLPVDNETERAANINKLLHDNGFREKGKLVAVQLGASESVRTWELEKFAETCRILNDHTACKGKIEILLTGSPDETPMADRFAEICDFPVINLAGKTDILDVPVLLEKCDLLISSDTGPVHIASARGTLVLGVYFASAYAPETGPYGENHIVVQSELDCNPCNEPDKCKNPKCRNGINSATVAEAAAHILFPDNVTAPAADSPEMEIYRSSFLADDTLIYYPLPGHRITERYRHGLIGRILWEPEERLEMFTDFLTLHLPQLKNDAQFAQMLIDYRAELQNLTIIFAHAVQWCHQIINEFSSAPVNREKIDTMVNQLTAVEQVMDKREEPLVLFKHYFNYEIMDMDYLQFPELAVEMVKKYSMFLRWVQSGTKKINALIAKIP